jgi:hypothetical protein
MTARSVRSLGLGSIMGCVVVVSVLCMASPSLANGCTVNGTFLFSTTGGTGRLILAADGRAAMILSPPSTCIDSPCGEFLRGTHETRVIGDGACILGLDFRPQPGEIGGGRTITMSAAVAFQGLVLMFLNSSDPALGAGLAIRADMLTGQ